MRPEDSAWESLRFQSWHSAPDVSFWQKLASLKLNQFQLNDQPQDIMGYFTPGRSSTVPARLTVDDSAFILSESTLSSSSVARTRYEWKAPGVLYNTNTMEAFKSLDKNEVMQKAGEGLMARMTEHPLNDSWDFLNSFVLITFADLKKHSFLYWFGFVTASTSTPMLSRPPVAVSAVLSVQEQREVMHGLMHLRSMNADGSAPVLNFPSFFVISRAQTQEIRVYSFETWRQEPPDDSMFLLFGFVDPCPLQTNPGWPLRNYLALLASLPSNKVSRNRPLTVLSFREHVRHTLEPDDPFECTSSLVFSVQTGNEFVFERETVKFLGWEPNARGKMGPRLMELSALLDPIRLAEQSVDLNLKLMLWRQLPMLQLDQLATTKCLVLGAGTLGCFTARSLLSWGFRNITMVDNSVVSHSNPVRQPLFEFNDVGKPKAACAAASLKRIFPLVNATAVHLSIPMAGHALSNEVLVKEAQEALQTLVELITSHDVVFLGTDSRESRWLPTVICAAQEKILLNSALGFDSYLVMRHGIGATKDAPSSLGCYFCNDIVSPRDSLKDRTLDQMCTVTRPGLAPIAAATAVELLVAVLHSPDGVRTSAEKPNDTSSSLGFVPHQLRGFLNSFATMVITGEAFDKCIACSEKVQAEYRADPFGLLQYACNSVTYLEELTGLHTLTQAADSFMDELEVEESDEDSLL